MARSAPPLPLTARLLNVVGGRQYLHRRPSYQHDILYIRSPTKVSSLAGLLLFCFVSSPCRFGSCDSIESSWAIARAVSVILTGVRVSGPALSGRWPRDGGVLRGKRVLSFVVVVAMMFLGCR